MKKPLLLLVLTFSFFFSYAQNYQCLQAGVKHYFINGNGYLRGIRIDSVKAIGDSMVYFPFHTPRGAYDITGTEASIHSLLNPNGGSWLGKSVVQKADGTFVFDSYWNDSVVIKTLAHTGDSWVMYKDGSSFYYTATIIAESIMPVLSATDSVKTILITAQNGSGIVTTDPLDSLTIILSKNYGFVQVPDLYTFPYHKPDSAYRAGLDFFLDRSTCSYSSINSGTTLPPSARITLFKLTNFINPTEQQLFNWNVGDVIESDNELGIPIFSTVTIKYLQDTIISKAVSGDIITYTVSGSSTPCSTYSFYPGCSLICTQGTYTFSDAVYPLMDTTKIPEESSNAGDYLFYFPADTSYCSNSPAYELEPKNYYTEGLGESVTDATYKLGIGKSRYHHADGDPNYETDRLIAYKIGGTTCGSFVPTAVISLNSQPQELTLFPNPASTLLNISAAYSINSIAIINLLGENVYTQNCNNKQVQVKIADLPTGVYFVKVNGSEVRRFVKE